MNEVEKDEKVEPQQKKKSETKLVINNETQNLFNLVKTRLLINTLSTASESQY
jgi:hypothetical protein